MRLITSVFRNLLSALNRLMDFTPCMHPLDPDHVWMRLTRFGSPHVAMQSVMNELLENENFKSLVEHFAGSEHLLQIAFSDNRLYVNAFRTDTSSDYGLPIYDAGWAQKGLFQVLCESDSSIRAMLTSYDTHSFYNPHDVEYSLVYDLPEDRARHLTSLLYRTPRNTVPNLITMVESTAH